MNLQIFFRALAVSIPTLLVAFWSPTSNVAADDGSVGVVQLEVFVRGDKSSADQVASYVADLKRRVPGLQILTRDVLQERSHLKRLYELSQKAGRPKWVVPAFHCCDRMYFGFQGPATSGPAIEELFTADVYTRHTCSRCSDAKVFLEGLKKRWPAIRFRIFEIATDPIARQRWQNLCSGSGSVPGLPVIDFGGHVIIGYQGDDLTGKEWETLIERKSKIDWEFDTPKPEIPDEVLRWIAPSQAIIGAMQWSPDDATQGAFDSADPWQLPEEATQADTGQADLESEPTTPSASDETIDVPVFGRLRVNDLGMPLFSFLVGLVDGFNPCAMWILVFLLSVLVNIKDRKKILLIAGTFVVVSGMAYYAFMAAWLNLFLLIGIARPVQIALGVLALLIGIVNVKDFFAFKKGVSLSIPESSKPGLYRRVRRIVEAKYLTVAIGGAIALAVVVNMVELLCTAGLPALYTQILTLQQLPPRWNYFYLGIYILAYMLDDAVLVAIVVATLSHRKLQEREGRWLKLFSGIVILLLGAAMIVRPDLLQLGH